MWQLSAKAGGAQCGVGRGGQRNFADKGRIDPHVLASLFMHDISLITTIALGLSAALLFGLLAKRVGLSPIVGYLIAGIAIGPHTPGFVGDAKIASQLAEKIGRAHV